MPLGGTLESTFGVRTLTRAIQTFAQEPSQKFFTNLFRAGSQLTVEGRTFEWDEVALPRNAAPIVGEDSPFPKVPVTDKTVRQSPLVHVKLSVDIPASRLFLEREPGALRPNARKILANELAALQKRIAVTLEYLSVSALLGSINTTEIEGSEAQVTLSQETTALAESAPWSNPATKILSDEIPKIVERYVSAAGRLPGLAVLNDQAERSLLKNQEIKEWAQHQYGASVLFSNSASEKVLEGLGLGGLDWRKAIGVYKDKTGAITRFLSSSKVIVLPPANELDGVVALAEGYGFVPRSLWGDEAGAGLVERAPSPGYYAYSEASANPVGIRLYAGWVGLPVLLWPTGVLILSIS
jgi:hypothetical protein